MEKLEDKKISIKAVITTIVAVSMSLFHLYTSEFGLLSAVVQRSIHLLFALLITFLTLSFIKTPKQNGKLKNFFTILDIIFMIFSCITLIYLIVGYKELILRGGAATTTDLIFGSILIILVLESTRRVLGLALPLITVIAILYAFFGDYLPGAWGHRALDLEQFITYQYLTTEGLFTIPLGVSASYIIIFIIFGAFLLNSGVGEFFIAFANSIAGSMRGGPAKVAVLSSATMGTISGSAVANVVSTGSFTIPLMKKIGYTPLFAGAVESVASTGGQFMPPIMGAAAFIIAEMLGIPYIKVCLAAAIPAILYFFSLFYMVHIEAIKQGLKGIPKNQLPSFKREVFSRGHLILPAIILVVLMVYGYSPMKAGFWAVISVVLISMVKKETRMDFKKIIKSLENGAKGSLQVVTACACAGIVIGVVTQTGLGLKFSTLVISAAKGYLFLSLIYVMLTSLILGMGLTTSAAYILTVIIGGPVLINLG
ncbi:MAG TPA: TRAP transporter fused permease subunit, partial [Candidatus Atribacteria bacterium]|nr:TRAP transporter fused permease subunit [Candidatus Atribacteria bacterium]